MRKTASTTAIALRPTLHRTMLVMLLLAIAAMLLPRLAGARPSGVRAHPSFLAAPVDLVTSGDTARVLVETTDDRVVTVEWGAAPYASHVTRSQAGKHHAVELHGLRPGGLYVYSVRVGGVLAGPPRPFVMPGAPAQVPATPLTLSL